MRWFRVATNGTKTGDAHDFLVGKVWCQLFQLIEVALFSGGNTEGVAGSMYPSTRFGLLRQGMMARQTGATALQRFDPPAVVASTLTDRACLLG